MSNARRDQLRRKSGKRITALFRKVIKAESAAAIDVTMYWPPEQDTIRFLFGVGRNKPDWDLEISSSHWRLDGDPRDKLPKGLASDLRQLFRACWKDVSRESPSAKAYLRVHDDIGAIDLQTGRHILDRARPEYQEPGRLPFHRPRSVRNNTRPDRDLIHRGDRLSKVKKVCGVTVDPTPENLGYRDASYSWPERGTRIWFFKGRVESVFYRAPFADKICGVWIGAHAWQVHELLGRANQESFGSAVSDSTSTESSINLFPTRCRIWEYERDGYLWLRFDDKDNVETIGR